MHPAFTYGLALLVASAAGPAVKAPASKDQAAQIKQLEADVHKLRAQLHDAEVKLFKAHMAAHHATVDKEGKKGEGCPCEQGGAFRAHAGPHPWFAWMMMHRHAMEHHGEETPFWMHHHAWHGEHHPWVWRMREREWARHGAHAWAMRMHQREHEHGAHERDQKKQSVEERLDKIEKVLEELTRELHGRRRF